MNTSKKLLVDYCELQYDKGMINEAIATGHGTVVIKGVLQRANAKNQNGRIYPKEILHRESLKYMDEFVRQRRALGELDHPECHRPSAEILTEDGWKYLKDVREGENVMTLNTSTNQVEIEPVLYVTNETYTGKMISITGKNIDVLVTPNHRFVLKDRKGKYVIKTAQEIYDLSKTVTVPHLEIPKAGASWSGIEYETFDLPAVQIQNGTLENRNTQATTLKLNASAWFEFLGIYLAEGHISNYEKGDGYKVFISQNMGRKANHIREVLSNLSPELTWVEQRRSNGRGIIFTVSDARLWTYLSQLGNKYTKSIPTEIKSASTALLQNLFNGYLLGDGSTVMDNGYLRTSIFSVSKQLMEDFQDVLLKVGLCGTIKVQQSVKNYVFAGHEIDITKKRPLYRLWVEKAKSIHLDFRFIKIEELDYDSTVHCVTVNNGTFYCRDNNKAFWSGNSTVVNLKNVSHNIIEMHWENDDLVGAIEILSTPSGNIVKELMKNGIKLGVSSRGVGSVQEQGDTVTVEEDFNLICFDIVSNPSTQGAFLAEGVAPALRNARLDSE